MGFYGIIESAEALPILCVRCVRRERERERKIQRETDGSDGTIVALKLAMSFALFLAKHLHLRAYSFCAVFLFRFINQNRNRRVQKERLSFERNNFHGNKMAQCLISNWIGKKYENIIRKRNSKKNTGDFLDRLLVFANPVNVIFFVLSRQSSNVYSWLRAGNGELLLCWQPSFSKGKAVRKMRNKTRNSLLCFPT